MTMMVHVHQTSIDSICGQSMKFTSLGQRAHAVMIFFGPVTVLPSRKPSCGSNENFSSSKAAASGEDAYCKL
jgi:hypothetical protein